MSLTASFPRTDSSSQLLQMDLFPKLFFPGSDISQEPCKKEFEWDKDFCSSCELLEMCGGSELLFSVAGRQCAQPRQSSARRISAPSSVRCQDFFKLSTAKCLRAPSMWILCRREKLVPETSNGFNDEKWFGFVGSFFGSISVWFHRTSYGQTRQLPAPSSFYTFYWLSIELHSVKKPHCVASMPMYFLLHFDTRT